MEATRVGLTLEQFLRLPEEKPALEYFDGLVSQKPPSGLRRSLLRAEVMRRINEAARSSRPALALLGVRATFAGSSLAPDVSVWRQQQLPVDHRGELGDDLLEPPALAIEVVAPGQSREALVDRARWYVSHGVEIAILVDPDRALVEAFRPDGTKTDWRGVDRIDVGKVVPGFDLTVEQLFSALHLR